MKVRTKLEVVAGCLEYFFYFSVLICFEFFYFVDMDL